MMKTILYATDYSYNSIAALQFAHSLSNKLKGNLIVLHVFDLSVTIASTVSLSYSRKEIKAFKEHKSRLYSFCEEHLGVEPDNSNITLKIIEGTPASEAIINYANEFKVDLIVVGKKGESAIKEALLGSTTSALIEKANCPVLAISEDTTNNKIKTIVYATAFEEADLLAIAEIVGIAEQSKASINVVHISTKEEYSGEEQMEWFKEMLQQKINYDKLNFELRFSEDVFSALNQYVDEINPDLLVMLERQGHSLIKSIWHRDIVKRMMTESKFPLMTFHKKNLKNKSFVS
ncbi:MAG: universal stress protein [Maribacter sp.]|nr:universal stress protein [Maribacter sp.]